MSFINVGGHLLSFAWNKKMYVQHWSQLPCWCEYLVQFQVEGGELLTTASEILAFIPRLQCTLIWVKCGSFDFDNCFGNSTFYMKIAIYIYMSENWASSICGKMIPVSVNVTNTSCEWKLESMQDVSTDSYLIKLNLSITTKTTWICNQHTYDSQYNGIGV